MSLVPLGTGVGISVGSLCDDFGIALGFGVDLRAFGSQPFVRKSTEKSERVRMKI